jgi:DNA-directed RNA polymerase subunit RPC12/RpoP
MNKCDNCGGEIVFTPEEKGNKCNNCGSVFEVEHNNNFVKKPLSDANKSPTTTVMADTKNLQCKSCGANMILNKLQTQVNCRYCGNTTILQGRNNKILAIDSVVPFNFKFRLEISLSNTAGIMCFFSEVCCFISGTFVNFRLSFSGTFLFSKTTGTINSELESSKIKGVVSSCVEASCFSKIIGTVKND